MPTAQDIFPELAPEAAERALRLHQARLALEQPAAAPANAPPPGPPVPPAEPRFPNFGGPEPAPLDNGRPQVAGAPFSVAPRAPYARVLPAGPAGWPVDIASTSIPPGVMQSTGPGGPNVGLPQAGSRVEQDPAWRQAMDLQHALNTQNPMLQALGGAQYGSNAIPTIAKARILFPGMTPQEYANILQVGGQQSLGQQRTNLEGMSLLGAGGKPGSLDVNRSKIESEGPERIREQQNMQLYVQGLQAHVAGGGNAQSWQRQWRGMGFQVPTALTQGGAASGQRDMATAPPGTQTVQTNRGARRETDTGETPFAAFEDLYSRAAGQGAQNRNATPERSIGEFLNRLDSSNPGHVQQNWDKVESFIRDRWGDRAYEEATRRAQSPRQIEAPRNIMQGILRSIPAAASLLRQAAGGPSQEEIGLSQLGNLLRNRNRPSGPPTPSPLRLNLPGEAAIANLP